MPAVTQATLYFIDTNVIVYCYDAGDHDKRARAIETLDAIGTAGTGVISPQVLSETYVTLIRSADPPLSPAEAELVVRGHSTVLPVEPLTAACVEAAMTAARQHAMSFWDALIWATAAEANGSCVLTEDCQHGRRIEGVLYLDPFDDSFNLGELPA